MAVVMLSNRFTAVLLLGGSWKVLRSVFVIRIAKGIALASALEAPINWRPTYVCRDPTSFPFSKVKNYSQRALFEDLSTFVTEAR